MICFILGCTHWTSLCRLLRGETLKVREMDFVTAAKTLGVSKTSILFKHILP
ncbi:MAG: ABC transporter permease subunit, partial [Flavobacteriaceae bacterium]|nr:ABC transporter permease subunit [Flavobacteriaceae bacterium]